MRILHRLAKAADTDLTGLPTRECVCTCDLILLPVVFNEDNEIGSYINTGFCVSCGAMLTVPTKENADGV